MTAAQIAHRGRAILTRLLGASAKGRKQTATNDPSHT
jgi:hypothetical protein